LGREQCTRVVDEAMNSVVYARFYRVGVRVRRTSFFAT
jgi:hypothetical protein